MKLTNQFMLERFSRTQLLIGKEGIYRFSASRVAVFGIGGVGCYVCEALESAAWVLATNLTRRQFVLRI